MLATPPMSSSSSTAVKRKRASSDVRANPLARSVAPASDELSGGETDGDEDLSEAFFEIFQRLDALDKQQTSTHLLVGQVLLEIQKLTKWKDREGFIPFFKDEEGMA